MSLETKNIEIGGRAFTVRVLSFRESRVVYARLGKLLALFGDDELKGAGVGPFVWASLGEGLTDADIEFYCKQFGAQTDVDLGDGRVVTLNSEAHLTAVFSGALDEMFEWLDFCVEANFGRLIEKMHGAVAKVAEKRAPKAQPKAE